MLAYTLSKIIDSYQTEKKSDFHKSNFPREISQKLPEIDDFTIKASFGLSRWAENPWITITHNSFDSAQESLQIEYKLDCENREVSLSIIPRLESYEEYTSLKAELINSLHSIDLNDFSINNDDASYSILDKKYGYNQLNDSLIDSDLDFILSIYDRLLIHFKNFVKIQNGEAKTFCMKDFDALEKKFSANLELNEEVFYSAPLFSVTDIKPNYPKEDRYANSLDVPEKLFTDDNIDKIIRCDIKIDDYTSILDDIKNTSQYVLINMMKKHCIDLRELEIRDKILLFAKSFTNVEYKSVGRFMGSYAFNQIKIDDRLSNPLMITSIIHELSHFILERILKEILMKILDTNDTPLISGFVKILLEEDLNYLLDEYCAHTVEGRFALFGFQDYSSFNYKLDEISKHYSKDDVDYALLAANSFAYDIKEILEGFINESLREEIKREFLYLPDRPDYKPLDLEIESRLEGDDFIEAVALILTSGIGETLNNPEKLERYMAKYD